MRAKTRKESPDHLVIVAHPDDETIFFSSVMMKFSKRCHVICVTDGDADGLGMQRQAQFVKACKKIGVKSFEQWSFADHFDERLPLEQLLQKLKSLPKTFKKVFTHGIIGEYGHPHHQDVSFAVHEHFYKSADVYSTAYNVYPDLLLLLTKKEFELKTEILWKIYSGEISRFLNFIPATTTEGFSLISNSEVSEIYYWLKEGTSAAKPLNIKKILKYRWLAAYLSAGGNSLAKRPF